MFLGFKSQNRTRLIKSYFGSHIGRGYDLKQDAAHSACMRLVPASATPSRVAARLRCRHEHAPTPRRQGGCPSRA